MLRRADPLTSRVSAPLDQRHRDGVVASMIVEVTARGDAMFLTMARRHAAHAIDADVESLWRGAVSF